MAQLLPHGTEFDGLRILGHLGSGTMGQVYLARQIRLDRLVAIKVFTAGDNKQRANEGQLLAEARAAAALSHPGIIGIHDVGQTTLDGATVHYLVMEYVDGEELQEYLERQGRPSDADFRRIVSGIVDALTYAATNGFTHRDLKPGNVMLAHDGRVKLADFGLAVRSGTDLGGFVVGTPAYLAPEQVRGGRVDHRSDQYAFGCLIFRMLTGFVPYDADSAKGLLKLHLQAPVPLACDSVECDRAWSDLAARLMSKAMDQRFDDPRELQSLVHALCAQKRPVHGGRSAASARRVRRRQRRILHRPPPPRPAPRRPTRPPTQAPARPAAAGRRQGSAAPAAPVRAAEDLAAVLLENDIDDEAAFVDEGPAWYQRWWDGSVDFILDLRDWALQGLYWLAAKLFKVGLAIWAFILFCLPIIRRALVVFVPPLADIYRVLCAWTWQVRVVRGYDGVLNAADDEHAMIACCPRDQHQALVWWMMLHPEMTPAARLRNRHWWGLALRHLRLQFAYHLCSRRRRARYAARLQQHCQSQVTAAGAWSYSWDDDFAFVAAACASGARCFPVAVQAQPSVQIQGRRENTMVPLPWATVFLAVGMPVHCRPDAPQQLIGNLMQQELDDLSAFLAER
ncbi:MAG: serine/threonine protein kinase [Planctomycetota bacterium]|nr:MAG: serine/threonine protein kinase [Planctomycetota bacterium]